MYGIPHECCTHTCTVVMCTGSVHSQEVKVQFEVRPVTDENRPAIRCLLQQVTSLHQSRHTHTDSHSHTHVRAHTYTHIHAQAHTHTLTWSLVVPTLFHNTHTHPSLSAATEGRCGRGWANRTAHVARRNWKCDSGIW